MVKGKGSKKGKKADRRASTTALNGTTVDEDVNYGDDNDPLDPEDLEYFQDSDRSFAFLQKVVADVPGSGKKRKRKKIEQEEEADYEKRPRTIQTEQGRNERVLLPIKSKDSIIPRTEKIPIVDLQEHTEQTDPVDLLPETIHQSTESPTLPPTLSMVELFNKRRQKLMQRKLRIAELSNSILENPQESVSELQELCKLCDERDTDVRITTKKLAMVSLLTVFKDIVPGYPIRRLTEKEQGVKLSKRKYLQILETIVEDYSKNQKTTSSNGVPQKNVASESVMLVAVQCMCDLLTSLPHFNFHTNLVTVLVPRMNDKSLDGQVSKLCYNAFVTLFKQDSVGSVSLETVKVISKFVKSKGFRVQPCVLETFLYLRINQLDIQSLKHNNEKKTAVELKIEKNKNRMEKKLKGKMSKKEKKRKREMKKLEKELQETEAVESQQKRAKLQTEILKFVFVTYFRVLKTVGHSPLLSPVLEGLAKFAHLINVDFFSDLMAALHDLLNNKELSLRETLNCVLTAIKILSGQGEALNIDPRGFYNTLYTKLLQVHVGFSNEDVPVVLQCLEEMLKKRRKQVPIQRVAGFVKRLCTVSLQSQTNGTLAFLSYVKSFLQSHTKVQAILDSESMGTGLFRPDVNDPELSNADSTTAWELALLETGHYHPAVRIAAHHVAEGAPSKGQFSTMMRMTPLEFWEQYDSSDMKLNPDMVENAQNRKEVNLKRIKHMKEGDWKSSDIELSIKAALDFTEASSVEVVFSLPLNAAER
ncbi:Nucleolar complex protein 3 [Porites harrisoni]